MNWTYNTIWREQLPPGAFVRVEFKGNRPALTEMAGASYFEISRFKAKNCGLCEIGSITTAEYLAIDFSNITSFTCISRLGPVKRLELTWCLKLSSDTGLSEIADSLEWLHINTCRKFIPTQELFRLKKLKVLCLNGCGPLENLEFLQDMPQLLDFRFVDTNVVNGDLTPLLEHPRLTNAGFLDKRHYNLKSSQIEAAFAPRQDNVREYAYKGEYRTFRYLGMGGGSVDA